MVFAFAKRVKRNFRYFPVIPSSNIFVQNNNFLVNVVSFPNYSGFRAKFLSDELWNMRTQLNCFLLDMIG